MSLKATRRGFDHSLTRKPTAAALNWLRDGPILPLALVLFFAGVETNWNRPTHVRPSLSTDRGECLAPVATNGGACDV